jgi:glycosyltransferase involved in cell wall biosynthesis
MEAMASALPVVSTVIAGIPELVADGRTGLLVAPGRADLLALALSRLAADRVLAADLGAAGRRAVLERHQPGDNVTRLVALWLATGCAR